MRTLRNHGHGHLYPRPHGVTARCGGLSVCADWARDAAEKARSMGVEPLSSVQDWRPAPEAGWGCPRCRVINAPTMQTCRNCAPVAARAAPGHLTDAPLTSGATLGAVVPTRANDTDVQKGG